MCSITEPRRATVSCKHLFSSTTNDRSIPTTTTTPTTTTSSSLSRRHISNNSNIKRSTNNSNTNNHPLTRSSNHTNKQSQRTADTLPSTTTPTPTNVFHIPFCFEQITDNGNKSSTTSNSKLRRTPLNPLSPAFFSTRHISLVSEQKPDIMSR